VNVDFTPWLTWLTSEAIYDSIPQPMPGSFPSIGFNARSTAEFGDHIQFAAGERALDSVVVNMTNWACGNDFDLVGGGWVPNRNKAGGEACQTTPGTGFNHDVTLNIYAVDNSGANPEPGALLGSVTDTFFMPYRPSWDSTLCTAPGETPPTAQEQSGGKWFDPVLNKCVTGYAFNIEFDMSWLALTLPEEVIFGVAYNTQGHGAAPIAGPGPYNSLNLSLTADPPTVGTNVDPAALFQSSTFAGFYCEGNRGTTGTFRWDGSCWATYTPAVEFYAIPPALVKATPEDALPLCSTTGSKEVVISINDVADLYGYQFDIDYSSSAGMIAGAPTPAYVNGWFTAANPTNGLIGCSGGTCTIAGTRNLVTDGANGVNGSGDVAKITLQAAPGSGGTFPLTISNVVLSDRNAAPIASETAAAPLQITVCGQATVTGKITLQGRFSGPKDAGLVTFTSLDSAYTDPAPVAFSPVNGSYSVTLDVDPAGTAYEVQAAIGLYISNRLDTYTFMPGANSAPQTQLRGGDANLLGEPGEPQKVTISDLQCIRDYFGPGGTPCNVSPAPQGSSDINKDNVTNVQDLALASGNFDRFSFRNWLAPDSLP
jgi:hypothetical protein